MFGTTQVKNCNWIGGVDLNEAGADDGVDHRSSGVTVLLSLNRRIQVVRIGEDARVVKVASFLQTLQELFADVGYRKSISQAAP